MSHKAFLMDAWKMFEKNPQMWKNVGKKQEKNDGESGSDKKEKTDGETASIGGTNEDDEL